MFKKEIEMEIRLDDQVALVTGAGRGLGRAHAIALAERGAKVIINDLAEGGAVSKNAEAVVEYIVKLGGEAFANGADVSDFDQVQNMVSQAMDKWGRIDILVNNAGILRDKTFLKMTPEDMRLVIDVHLMGSMYCAKAVWGIMREQAYGRIVFTSSSSGLYGNFGQANYGAAKMAMVGMMNTLHLEGMKYNINVNCLAPEAGGKWMAIRKVPKNKLLPPKAVDITGIWTPAPGVDFRKYSMDLTEKAKLWHKDYIDHYDQPNVRCVSPGIVAISAWGAYPFEILKSEERFTFLYEVDSEVRRVYMNKKEPPSYYPTSGMGFSNGYWNGSDLIIETQLLEGNVRDFRGEPISDGAKMHERYTLSEDGETLSAVLTLLDPENYEKPPIRRRKWTRNPSTEIYPYECDPDSFYRQMYNENKLEMYFERSYRRQID